MKAILIVIVVSMVLCACQPQRAECTPDVNEAQRYRIELLAETEAQARMIQAEGIGWFFRSIAFGIVLCLVWIARKVWYW